MIKFDIKEALIWNSGLRFFIQALTFVFSIILARILEPKDFGIMALGMVVVNYANTITDFGFYNALIQRENLSKIQINSVFTLNLSLSILLTASVVFFAEYLATAFHSEESRDVFRALSLIFLTTSFSGTMTAVLKRDVKHKSTAKIDMMASISSYSCSIILALNGMKYWSLAIGTLLGHLVRVAGLFAITSWLPKLEYNHQKMKEIYSYGIWNFLRAQMFYINNYIFHVFIGLSMSAQSLGFFDRGFELSAKPMSSFGKPINSVMFSSFSRLQSDKKQLASWFKNLLIIQTLFIVPMYVYIFVLSAHIVIVLLEEKWAPIIVPVKLLCIARLFLTYSAGMTTLNIATSQHKVHTTLGFALSVLLVILCAVFFKHGINGICIAYMIYGVFSLLVFSKLALKVLEIKVSDLIKEVLPYFSTNLVAFLAIDGMTKTPWFENIRVESLIALSFMFPVVYVPLIMLVNRLKKKHPFYPFNNLLPKSGRAKI